MEDSNTNTNSESLISSLFDESLLSNPIFKEVTSTFYYIDTKNNYDNNQSINKNIIGFTEYRSLIENNIQDGEGVVKVIINEDASIFMSSKSELTEEEIADLKKRGYDLVGIVNGEQIEYIVLNENIIEKKEYLTKEEANTNYSEIEGEYKVAVEEVTTSMLSTLASSGGEQTIDPEEAAKARKSRAKYEAGKQDLTDRMQALNLLGEDEKLFDSEVQDAVDTLSNADIDPDPGYLARSITKIDGIGETLENLHNNIKDFELDKDFEIIADFIDPSKAFVKKLIDFNANGDAVGSVMGYSIKLKNFRQMLMSMNPDWELYENVYSLQNLESFGEAEGLSDLEMANLSETFSKDIQREIIEKTNLNDRSKEEQWIPGLNKKKQPLLYDPEGFEEYREIYDFATQAKDYYDAMAFNRIAYDTIVDEKDLTDEEKAFYSKNENKTAYKGIVEEYSQGKFKMLAYDHIVNNAELTSEQQAFYDKWYDDDVVEEYSAYRYCTLSNVYGPLPQDQQEWYDGYTEHFNEYAEKLDIDIAERYEVTIANGTKVQGNNKYDSDNPYLDNSYYICEVPLTEEERQEAIEKLKESKSRDIGRRKTRRAIEKGIYEYDDSIDEEIIINEDEIPKTKKVAVYNPYSLATPTERFIIATWAEKGAYESQKIADDIKNKRDTRIDEIGDITIHDDSGEYITHINKSEYKDYGYDLFYGDASEGIKRLSQNITYIQYRIDGYENREEPLNDEEKEALELDRQSLISNQFLLDQLLEKIDLVNPNGTYGTSIYENESKANLFRLKMNQCQYASIMEIPAVNRTDIQNDYINVGYPQFIYSYENFHLARQYEIAEWNKGADEYTLMNQMLDEYSVNVISRLTSSDTNNIYSISTNNNYKDDLYLNYVNSINNCMELSDKIQLNNDKSFNLSIYLHDFDEKCHLRIKSIDIKNDGKYRVITCYDENGNVIEDAHYEEISLYYLLNGKDIPDKNYYYKTGWVVTLPHGWGNTDFSLPSSGLYIKSKDGYTNIYDYIKDGYNGLNKLDDTEVKTKILSYMDTKALEENNFDYFKEKYDHFVDYGKRVEGKKIAQEWLKRDTNEFLVTWRSLGKGFEQFFHGFACIFGGADRFTTPEDYALMYYSEGLVTQFGSSGQLVQKMSEILTSIGNMAIPMVVGIAGQILNYFCPPVGAALSWASTALMGISAGGNAFEQGLKQGMETWSAVGYGILVGLSEAFLEKFLGGIDGLSSKWFGSTIASTLGINTFLADIISEGIEESIQEMLDPLFKFVVTGGEIKEKIDWANVLKSGLYGMITAGIMNGGTLAINSGISLMLTGTPSGLNTILSYYQDGKLKGNTEVFKAQLQRFKALNKMDPNLVNTKLAIMSNPSFDQNYKNYSDTWDAYKSQLEDTYEAIKNDKTKKDEAKAIKEQLKTLNETGKLSSEQFVEQLIIESIMNNVAANSDTYTGLKSNIIKANLAKVSSFNGDISKISEFLATQLVAGLNGKIQAVIDGNVDAIKAPLNAIEVSLPILQSDQNVGTIKYQILSQINENMSQLEKARLIYKELGQKVDYSVLVKYAQANDSQLYKELFYKALGSEHMTMADVETTRDIICIDWAYLYSEMLIAAGFSADSIVIQGIVDADGNIVEGSHAGIYVMLDDGSVIMPDLTVPLGNNGDYYNLKVGNETTGFIYFTPEQVQQIAKTQLDNHYISYTIENNSRSGKPISSIFDSFLNNVGDYLYAIEFSNPEDANIIGKLSKDKTTFVVDQAINDQVHELMAEKNISAKEALKQLGYNKKYCTKLDAMRERFKEYFGKIRKTNSSIISSVDTNIEGFVTKSDFFYQILTEELIAKRKVLEIDAKMIESGMLTEKFLCLDNINSTNMITIYSYIKEMANKMSVTNPNPNAYIKTRIKLDSPTSPLVIIDTIVNNQAGSSFAVHINEEGKIAVNKLINVSDVTNIYDIIANNINLENSMFAVNNEYYTFNEFKDYLNSKNALDLPNNQVEKILQNKSTLESYYLLLNDENSKAFTDRILNNLDLIATKEVDVWGNGSYTLKISDEVKQSLIQHLDINEETINKLQRVIPLKQILDNISSVQIDNIIDNFDSFSTHHARIIIDHLTLFSTDEVFLKVAEKCSHLGIGTQKIIDRFLTSSIPANEFFAAAMKNRSMVNKIKELLYSMGTISYDFKTKFFEVTDENIINQLVVPGFGLSIMNSEGDLSFPFRYEGKTKFNGKEYYTYKTMVDRYSVTLYSEYDILSTYLLGSKQLQNFIADNLLSTTNLEQIRLNQYGFINNLNIDPITGKIEIATVDTSIFEIFKNYSNLFADWFDIRKDSFSGLYGVDQQYDQLLYMGIDGKYHLSSPKYQASYNSMLDFITKKYNMSHFTVEHTLVQTMGIESGICSYANLANIIFMKYANNPSAFKQVFGFDMYTEIDGKKVLNSTTLLMDMFIFMNSESNGGNIYHVGDDGTLIFSDVADSNESGGVRLADSREQVYATNSYSINTYLWSLGLNLKISDLTNGIMNPDLRTVNINELKNRILTGLAEGKYYALSEYAKASPIDGKNILDELVFYSLDGHTKYSTNNWNEGGGHITAIIGVTDEGLIVISWGKKCLVKFSDLLRNQYGYNFEIEEYAINDEVPLPPTAHTGGPYDLNQ